MKIKTFLSVVFSFILLSTSVFAQKTSIFHLKVYNNAPFAVAFDDQKPQEARSIYTLKNIPEGRHLIRVFQRMANTPPNKPPMLIFEDRIEINDRREIFAYIDAKGRYRIHQIIHLSNDANNPYLQPEPTPEQPNYVPEQPQNSPQIQPVNPVPTPAPTANVMSNEQFNNLRNAVKDSNFDDQRLEIAKQGIKANTLSIEQIRALIDVFSFESSKVEIAKFAYNYTPDKNRYAEIYSAFKFSSSTDEVIKYINTQR